MEGTSPGDRIRILLVSATSLVGRNVLATLEGRRDGVEVVATGSIATELTRYDFDRVHLTPETVNGADAFVARLTEIVARERPDVVVPCRDDDVEVLAHLRRSRPGLGAALLCGSRDAARAMCDKWLSFEFSRRHDLPFAPSLASGEGDAAAFAREHGFPLVAKPRAGFASRGVLLVTDEVQLRRALARGGYVVQRFLGDRAAVDAFRDGLRDDGIPLFHSFESVKTSLQTLIAPDGSPAPGICTVHAMRAGKSESVERDGSPDAAALLARCAHVFAAAGWRGPLNVQCVRADDGALSIHEFNGRFTGATAGRASLGHDEVGAAVLAFTGRRLGTPPRRCSVAPPVAADPAAVAALVRDGEWERSRRDGSRRSAARV